VLSGFVCENVVVAAINKIAIAMIDLFILFVC